MMKIVAATIALILTLIPMAGAHNGRDSDNL